MKKIRIDNAEIVLSRDECGFEEVLNDFENSNLIYIITYSFQKKDYYKDFIKLKEKLESLNKDVEVNLVTNFPQNWNLNGTGSNESEESKEKAKKKLKELEESIIYNKYSCKLNSYINYRNHSKIYITKNLCYIGSENFTNKSIENYEAGVLIRDKAVIREIEECVKSIIEDSLKVLDNENIKIAKDLRKDNNKLREYMNLFKYIQDIENIRVEKYLMNCKENEYLYKYLKSEFKCNINIKTDEEIKESLKTMDIDECFNEIEQIIINIRDRKLFNLIGKNIDLNNFKNFEKVKEHFNQIFNHYLIKKRVESCENIKLLNNFSNNKIPSNLIEDSKMFIESLNNIIEDINEIIIRLENIGNIFEDTN